MKARYQEILAAFGNHRLAVVGDSMVDRFLWGRVERISPEAPVPVVKLQEETVKLGGAANVASNLRALGAEVTLFGVIGNDDTSRTFGSLLADRGISGEGMIECAGRPTTLKTRIIAHSQQVVRADSEDDSPLGEPELAALLDRVEALGPFDGIILSDYGKGVLNRAALPRLISRGRETGAIVTVDPKNGDFRQYHGVTSLTPNQREAELACALAIEDQHTLDEAGGLLIERTGCQAVLITRGENGMALYEADGGAYHLQTEATEVFDVTGAGDTVIATYTVALIAGASFLEAANLANHAAGLAVRELGTAAVTAAQIAEAIAR